MMRLTGFVLVALLAGCGAGNDARYLIDPPAAGARVSVRVGSIEVRDVSLPSYAAAVDIARQEPDGALRNVAGTLWADDPVRGITGALARSLDQATTASVAAEPWPLEGFPEVELTVRVEHMFAREDGSITLVGYYAIRREHGRSLIRQFDITRPAATEAPDELALVYEAAWSDLAERIARDL